MEVQKLAGPIAADGPETHNSCSSLIALVWSWSQLQAISPLVRCCTATVADAFPAEMQRACGYTGTYVCKRTWYCHKSPCLQDSACQPEQHLQACHTSRTQNPNPASSSAASLRGLRARSSSTCFAAWLAQEFPVLQLQRCNIAWPVDDRRIGVCDSSEAVRVPCAALTSRKVCKILQWASKICKTHTGEMLTLMSCMHDRGRCHQSEMYYQCCLGQRDCPK